MIRRFRAPAAGRADRVVAEQLPGSGRKLVARLFAEGGVRVNGRRAKKGELVAEGDLVELEEPAALAPVPEALPLVVLHEDEALVAFDKPPGMASQPLVAGERGTLAGRIVARYPECAGAGADPREAGLVHRLDTGTTGVIVAARSRASWDALREAFRGGQVHKEYLALAQGLIDRETEIDLPIAHDHAAGGVRAGDREGALPAYTVVVPLASSAGRTLVRCELRTGRMHQIRAHLGARGWPIVGDERYGGPAEPAIVGHFLHASRVELPHPATGARLRLEAPLPADRLALLGGFPAVPARDGAG